MIESYNSPTKSPEKSDDDSTEANSDKRKSKYSNKTVMFSGKVAEGAFDSKPAKSAERAESLWERWVKMDAKAKAPGDAAAEKTAGSDAHESRGTQEAAAEYQEVPLEVLSPAEAHAVLAEYAESRKKSVRQETREDTAWTIEDSEESADMAAVEDAADVALLEAIEDELAENPDRTIEEIVDTAEARTVERIDAGPAEAAEGTDSTEGEPPESPEELPVDGGEVEIPLRAPSAETGDIDEDDESVPAPSGPAGSSGSSVPPVPPITPVPVAGAGGSAGGGGGGGRSSGGGGGGSVPPRSPFGGYGSPGGPGGYPGPVPRVPAASFNMAPVTPLRTVESAFAAERRALAQGVLLGGIIGYLIGKRRGRIKTEKKLMPIQKKLEKQVTTLQETVALKEQNVRKLAGEKAQALSMLERKNLAERLAPVRPAERPQAAELGRAAEVAQAAERARAPEPSRERPQTGIQNRREMFSPERAEGTAPRPAESMSRVIVDAPAVVLGGVAALRPELSRRGASERRPNAAPVVDFSKKVEAYNTEELKQAAEKIRIDNTTLKELYDDGRLDEKAVRRVMEEFVDGGSVRAAVSRELLQKELKFERDPKMRDSAGASAVGGAGAGTVSGSTSSTAAGTIVAAIFGASNQASASQSDTGDGTGGSTTKPQPDKATLDKLRKKQMAEVAAAGTAIIGIFGAIIALLI